MSRFQTGGRLRIIFWLGWSAVVGLQAGCVEVRPLEIRLDPDVVKPARSVVIFFADGMDQERMVELVAEGRLPNIKQRFLDGGVGVTHAFSSFPSITYANCSSMITGRFPGHHHILGNFWFDRRNLECHSYMTLPTYRMVNQHLAAPTLYDLLADGVTLNIQGHTRRGVTHTIDNTRVFAWSWILGCYTLADWHVGHHFEDADELANQVNEWPTVIMSYYPGVDEVGHRSGPGSERYAEALQNIDEIVGRVTSAWDQAGLSESTYFVLIADHGMAPVGTDTQLDLLKWLRQQRHLKLRTDPIDLKKYPARYALMESYDAVANVDAGRAGMVHLRGKRGWHSRLQPNEVREWIEMSPSVRELDAVQVAFLRDGPQRVRALFRDGELVIERRRHEGRKQYRLAEYVHDPLGYQKDEAMGAFLQSGWRNSREWLAATACSRFPDFVPQTIEMFDSPRTGDVVLMASPGWSFYTGEVGGHGSCTVRDMRIPLYIAGPDLPAGAAIPCGRLVDLVPTLLGLLGKADRLSQIGPIDGIDLSQELRQGRPLCDPDLR